MNGLPDQWPSRDAKWIADQINRPPFPEPPSVAFLRCACGLTTIEQTPGEATFGSCPICGPLFAIPADVFEQVEAILGWMAWPLRWASRCPDGHDWIRVTPPESSTLWYCLRCGRQEHTPPTV